MIKLNGWQRLGVIASVVWMLFGAIATIKGADDRYQKTTQWALGICWNKADKAREERYRNLDAEHLQYDDPELAASRKSIQDAMDQEYNACAGTVWIIYPRPPIIETLTSEDFIWAPVMLAVAWFLCWGILGLGRWVGRGFRQGRA